MSKESKELIEFTKKHYIDKTFLIINGSLHCAFHSCYACPIYNKETEGCYKFIINILNTYYPEELL